MRRHIVLGLTIAGLLASCDPNTRSDTGNAVAQDAQATDPSSRPSLSSAADAPPALDITATTHLPPVVVARAAAPLFRIKSSNDVIGCQALSQLGSARAALAEFGPSGSPEIARMLKAGDCWSRELLPTGRVFVDLYVDVPWRASFDDAHWQKGVVRAALVRSPMDGGDMYWWLYADDLEYAPGDNPPS